MSSEALRSYLRTLRAEQRITQRQLAYAAGVPEKLIATWERGQVGSLKDGVLLRVAAALRAPWEELIAMETGWSLEAEDGQRRALRRTACLRANEPTPPAPFVVRVLASPALAARIDQLPLPIAPRPGTRIYEGQHLAGDRVLVLVNEQPIREMLGGSGIAVGTLGWGHPGRTAVNLACAILWCEFGDASTALSAECFAREVLATIPWSDASWVLAGCEVRRWVVITRMRSEEEPHASCRG